MANEPRKPGNNALSSIKTIIMAYLQHTRKKKGKKAIKFGIMAWWGDTAVLLFFNTQ